ncbi:KGGVGR-motif variant AAA ATPase [Streptomyces sp. FL07-04A]|uniref:KGGVGR-motif variant AAA ATPase n=1 Tax=Streptomyces sp. FL07-04A TaxID=3028658 RepID=UPI0029A70F14|nr:AAA family ATPase [Streptomyces sp. FL07-04A]MDX3579765.1 AAA family ATPase [Streptomyces sp. FL07-04A]
MVLVRDVLGRFSLVVDDTGQRGADRLQDGWAAELTGRLGRYRSAQPVLLASEMFSAEAVLNSPRAVPDPDPDGPSAAGSVLFLDNTVVGEDWANVSLPGTASGGDHPYRIALYGFKGGVGRTTAMSMLARELSDQGRCVLVVDLDLESPGAGPLLVGRGLPPYGLVDQLVESAVGNAEGLETVTRSSYTPRDVLGELWVAPARGGGAEGVPYSYVDKLNRVYADAPGASFADRLEQAVCACEDAVERLSDSGRRPDVVLLDSRAGIHDVAAVAISRLSDLALLFGANNEQTWEGYGDLFTAWRASGQASRIEEKLRMVASMVPDSVHYPMEEYLKAFRGRAFECFSVLYGEVAPGETGRENDESAPHWAIPILFEPGLVGMDGGNAPGWQDRAFVRAAYGEFLSTVTELAEFALAAGGDREGT